MLLKFWHTIQFKIIISLGAIFFVICTFLVVLNFRLYRAELIKALSQSAINLNESLISSLEMAMLSGNRDVIQRAIDRIGHDQHLKGLFIADKNGTIQESTDSTLTLQTLDINHPICKICHTLTQVNSRQSIIYKNSDGSNILRTVSPINNSAACYSCHNPDQKILGVLFLDYSLSDYEQQISKNKTRIVFLGGFTILFLAFSTFIFLNNFIIKRVKKLVQYLQRIGAGDLLENLNTNGNDEFSILGNSINQMSYQIKESINKISEQRDYLQKVIDNVQDGLVVVDKNFNILLVNEVLLKFIGKKFKDIHNVPCYEILGRDIFKKKKNDKKCPSASVFTTGKFSQMVYTYKVKNLEKVIEISASPIFNEDGKVIQSIEIFRDITEKEQMKSELHHSEKMAMIGRLAAGVAHEINNPLGTISTCADGLLERINESNEKLFRTTSWLTDYLHRINKCVYRCKSIIEHLLVFSRTTKKMKTTFDLNTIITETFQLLPPGQRQEQKQVILSLSPSPVQIEGNPNQMSQLVLNMLMNSLDAITSKGKVEIITYDKNDFIHFEISDTGKGISEENINHIFEPFFTTKEIGRGTGLGLAICQQIVNDHQGKIKVDSVKGQGCKFEIIFPKAFEKNVSS